MKAKLAGYPTRPGLDRICPSLCKRWDAVVVVVVVMAVTGDVAAVVLDIVVVVVTAVVAVAVAVAVDADAAGAGAVVVVVAAAVAAFAIVGRWLQRLVAVQDYAKARVLHEAGEVVDAAHDAMWVSAIVMMVEKARYFGYGVAVAAAAGEVDIDAPS